MLHHNIVTSFHILANVAHLCGKPLKRLKHSKVTSSLTLWTFQTAVVNVLLMNVFILLFEVNSTFAGWALELLYLVVRPKSNLCTVQARTAGNIHPWHTRTHTHSPSPYAFSDPFWTKRSKDGENFVDMKHHFTSLHQRIFNEWLLHEVITVLE